VKWGRTQGPRHATSRRRSRELTPAIEPQPRDYHPNGSEIAEFEQIFGDLLTTGHSVREAADFLIRLGHGTLDY